MSDSLEQRRRFENKLIISLFWIFAFNIAVVSSYLIADMSIFGHCVLHIKRVRDNSVTSDIASILVASQFRARRYPIVSISSANNTRFIMPEGSIREGCSLNVIIGFFPRDSYLLYGFMYANPYTYLSRLNSIYVLILDYLPTVDFPEATITLPASIFILKFPPFYIANPTALHSNPSYFYICLSCLVRLQPVINNKYIRFHTEHTYQKQWKHTNLIMQVIVYGRTGQISWCEMLIWRKWLAPKGDARRTLWRQCNKPAAFWDLVLRSTHPNFTTYLQPIVKVSQVGFSGTFSQKLYMKKTNPTAWSLSNSFYAGTVISGIIYCDCERRSESVSFEIWNVGFGKIEWALIIALSATVSACTFIESYCLSIGRVTKTYIAEFINVMGVILRQGSYKGFLLALFSLGMFSNSLLFENILTSCLVAPTENPPLNLAELIDAGYHILVPGNTTPGFSSNLPYLLEEFEKLNVTFNLNLVAIRSSNGKNNSRTFEGDKSSIFFISTMKDKAVIQQAMKSKCPEHCTCHQIRNEFSHYPVYSFIHHKLALRIFYIVQLLTEAGFHNFFDWNFERREPDFISKSESTENSQTSSGSFISLKNLSPLLLIFAFLLLFSILTFSCELRYLAYRMWLACQFKSKLSKCFHLHYND
jgi:hypothetical protein